MAKTNTSFKPGQSGNPNGRPPKGESWAEILAEACEEVDPNSGKQFKHRIAEVLLSKAVEGNIRAMKVLFDRMEGTPKQTIETNMMTAKDLTDKELEALYDEYNLDITTGLPKGITTM